MRSELRDNNKTQRVESIVVRHVGNEMLANGVKSAESSIEGETKRLYARSRRVAGECQHHRQSRVAQGNRIGISSGLPMTDDDVLS